MPTFDTPGPIAVTAELGVGDLRVVASDRTDTIVEVRPSDPTKKADVTAAEQTRVEYADGRLLIKTPKSWRQLTWRGGGESIDVQVDLPAGSHLRGDAGVAALHCRGRLGECRYRTGVGEIQLDQAGPVQLKTGGGDVTELRVGGYDPAREPDAVRDAIGVTGQFSAVDNLLTGEENVILMADLRHLGRREGRRRAAELLDQFDLVEAAKKPAATYSGGMRRRLDLAMGLVGDPRIIFLDEPTAGLDPRSRRTMWQIIRDLVAGGDTIFLTTQYLEEADELADRIALLDHGKLVAEGTADELKRRIPGGHISLRFAYADELESAARTLGTAGRDDEALTMQVPSDGSVKSLRALLDRLDRASIEVDSLSVHTPDLDDVFLTLTGQPDKEKELAR
jgi:ABC-2 type transport system ATP-binding protein